MKSAIALVLGATGGIGGAVATRLHRDGYRVRALHRNAGVMQRRLPIFEWVQGDAMIANDVVTAAAGADVIVHAVNPPGYRNWGTMVLPMIDNTIAAAKRAGATILMPGTVYNYGPDSFPDVREDSPQNPVSVKGRIRVELERRLEIASTEGVRVLIVRAGDYFGPGAANNWFSQVVVKAGKPVTSITNPASPQTGHQWAYLPDVAETMARLLAVSDRLPTFARFHMDGFFDRDGIQLAAAIRRVVGKPDLPIKRFPWLLVRLSSPLVPMFRELLEMRYLWKQIVRLDNRALVDFLGEEPHTPIDHAVRATLEGLRCLPPAAGLVSPPERGRSVEGAMA
ncbi:NAD(P)H-binding protein [Ciceribacter sp. L1K23]|uniref:NAD-dependent epimerase/dehydratase family protein n=1 Tax=Ciceribacter sp. L1K23 TaxID=2820276 RepID=UPI001B834C51|nr:NAD-dependent epimerase/dehydratase family protein [Ciceribacter sp. L1K23]MBR0554952.1 NAD(P)H-binding protein [Ciceribacter sp. L1K23]